MTSLARRCAAALAATVLAATAGPLLAQAQGGTYEAERARCLSGQSDQARDTCLKEAGAAQDEARRGQLGAGGAQDLQRNATQRCDAQPPADRAACVQRIVGGASEGSVGGGGLIRQTETPAK